MLGLRDATHAEYGTQASTTLITPAACPLGAAEGTPRVQGKQRVRLDADSLTCRIYGQTAIEEEFYCSYELNPEFQPLFERSGLRVAGVGDMGEARVVELADADFFIGTLFLPQMAALAGESHPLIDAYFQAVLRSQR